VDATRHPQSRGSHTFILGADYHLGDLLWLTAVLHQYRCMAKPQRLTVVHPRQALLAILERNPDVDDLLTAAPTHSHAVVHDLRPIPIGVSMVRDWRYRLPWLYYRDLWCQPRGQWLATYLRLGRLQRCRPVLELGEEDFAIADTLDRPYVVLAPHIGQYRSRALTRAWSAVKGWPLNHWTALTAALHRAGYQTVTLGAHGQAAIPETQPMLGLPIRQVAGIIDRAAGLISGESGLWFIAAARARPFVIVPWWLPRSIDWPAPMNVPYRLVHRREATVDSVLAAIRELVP